MTTAELKIGADTAWTILTAFLVFFMNAGFGLLEAGLCRRKNATMILSKNFVVFAISTLGFYFVGFGLMFSDGGWVGSAGGWLLGGDDNSPATGAAYHGVFGSLSWTGIPLQAKFLFELVFCGTTATIVSGSVNERMKYASFLVFSVIITAGLYPISGHWAGEAASSRAPGCETSRAPQSSIALGAGQRWRASWCWDRASVATRRERHQPPSQDTTWATCSWVE